MEYNTTQAVRSAFLNYFKNNGHNIVPSASIVPVDDDTLLFTNAGMVPFKQYFLNPKQAPFTCAASAQRCLRVGGKHNDLDNVGYTTRHHTYFEMLGNFSFGAYGKKEAITHALTLLVDVFKIDIKRLWVTVYEDDAETEKLWLEHFKFPAQRLVRCGAKDNFWSMGDTGPCGPCTEIFFDHGPDVAGGPPGSPDEDGDRYVEIWNLVFMQFDKQADGQMIPLKQLCVDTGMGLERICAVLQSVSNNYDVDVFSRIIDAVHLLHSDKKIDLTAARVIADHMRSICWMLVEGIFPANEGRGYVLRRVIRRALRYAYKSGIALPCLYKLVPVLAKEYAHETMFTTQVAAIQAAIEQEERAFAATISQGLALFEQIAGASDNTLDGAAVFKLYDTYGFPLDLVQDLARERGLHVDNAGFDAAMSAQKQRSRQNQSFTAQQNQDWAKDLHSIFVGYDVMSASGKLIYIHADQQKKEQLHAGDAACLVLDSTPFYAESGGQVGDQGMIKTATGLFQVEDTQKLYQAIVHYGKVIQGSIQSGQDVSCEVDLQRQKTACNHSATHLLHAALRLVLGEHVVQKGSLVTPQRLRFDFSHSQPLTSAQLFEIENIVNAKIQAALLVQADIMPFAEAKSQGVMALFTEKYQEQVRVLSMGTFSKELCGGIHVANTAHIGLFVIVEETGIAQGVRRIEAYTGECALAYYQGFRQHIHEIASTLKVSSDQVVTKVTQLQQQLQDKNKQLQSQAERLLLAEVPELLKQKKSTAGCWIFSSMCCSRPA